MDDGRQTTNDGQRVAGLRLARPFAALGLICLLAFVLRLHRLAEPVLRWDEGWSLAHASLNWGELVRIAALDWHPPLYTALLKLWIGLAGVSTFSLRYLSVLLGVLAVPLAYVVARVWLGASHPRKREGLALLAALYAAVAPLLVYYGQVVRMYPLATLAVLAAGALMLRDEGRWVLSGRRTDDRKPPSIAGLALTVATALYSLYYTLWPLAGLLLYGALTRPRQIGRLALAVAGAALLYLPWLLLAGGTLMARTASGGGGADLLAKVQDYLAPTLQGLLFTYDTPPWAAGLIAAVLITGLIAGRPGRAEAGRLLLPVLVVALSIAGLVYGAIRTQWFAPRHLASVVPFFGLALAWALDALRRAWRPLLPLALGLLVIAFWSTSTQFVYAKTLEVVDPFDPTADYRFLAVRTHPDDIVFFNVLSTAGWYESLRRPQDPPWSHALRWEPVIQPVEDIVRERILPAAAAHQRLWFVLYKGTVGTNAALKEWLDTHLYPVGGAWNGDTLILAYTSPQDPLISVPLQAQFGDAIQLTGAEYTPRATANGVIGLVLHWQAQQPVTRAYKVFVHLTDDAGWVFSQHDAQPVNDLRPTMTWMAGERIVDRHGLFLPMMTAGTYHVRVGLYAADTGERLRTSDGRDMIEVGTVVVTPTGPQSP